ncbi:MAG TPA: hypothetical protein VKV18_02195 [Chthonomonas sp.]|uniref:hypothetical protein n=1 Tax=Chthonomonas sp. TaxID=2282153 RepID=UPI002B4B8501|nr:hypothetical protein [Chthonomonas sp.]HLI47490.1 hypothetical protein [Chthonomonas sp.]
MPEPKERPSIRDALALEIVELLGIAIIHCGLIMNREMLSEEVLVQRFRESLTETAGNSTEPDLPEALRGATFWMELLQRMRESPGAEQSVSAVTPAGLLAQEIEKDLDQVLVKAKQLYLLLEEADSSS